MSRYIDADAVISFVDAGHLRNPLELTWSDNDVVDMIESRPTVDAVPVVASDRNKLCPINHGLRCKDIEDCAFWCEWGQCAVKAIAVACAYGERTHG